MALIFMDGFDKYGGLNSSSPTSQALLQGDWTSVGAGSYAIVAGLSATGFAVQQVSSGTLSKTLAGSYGRLIGGVRFNTPLGIWGIQFADAASNQAGININITGTVSMRNGIWSSGTILGTSASSITANTTHYLEWDITFGNAAAYQIWMDGVSILSGTGDTTTTANNTANGFSLNTGNSFTIFDDFYLFDTTGSTNNAVLLTSPRIETTFPASDNAVQFGVGAAVLGSPIPRATGANTPAANSLSLRRYVPTVSMTINSIGIMPNVTSGTANYRGVIYADSAGAAGTLMSSGTTVTGVTVAVAATLPLTTPQSLTGGTPYWFGFMNDTSLNFQLLDANLTTFRAAATFGSGAPGTAPGMTASQPNYLFWGNVTVTGANYYAASQQPPPGAPSYVFDATVGHEDLYNFNALSVPPINIYAVAVKGYLTKSDSGTKTISLRTKSGATDSGGSLTGQALGTTYSWMASLFPTDPNTSAAWTGSALNAATSGVRVDS